MRFKNRSEGGRALAGRLAHYAGRSDVVVLGLPRGGVPVAYEVARALGASLDVFVVRKLGLPGQQELAMGAIASGGVQVLNEDLVRYLRIPESVIEQVATKEKAELERRERQYRSGRSAPELRSCVVILVDDGLATGATMRAAVAALRQHGPARVVVAAPVASAEACLDLSPEADECVCVAKPAPFYGVGAWYVDFSQTSDATVRDLLARAQRELEAEVRIL